MEQFDLKTATNILLDEFYMISDKDTIALLEWFYRAINYKSIFEVPENAKKIYNRLLSRGYEEVKNSHEEYECFKKLMERTVDDSEERVGSYLISLVMKSLKENKPLPVSVEQLICIYNETYNKKHTYENMMASLETSVGGSVVFVISEYGKLNLLTGTLVDVDPFHSVTIDNEIYAFIGSERVISKITDINGKVLYNNGRATSYDNLRDSSKIEKQSQDLFGRNYYRVKPM